MRDPGTSSASERKIDLKLLVFSYQGIMELSVAEKAISAPANPGKE